MNIKGKTKFLKACEAFDCDKVKEYLDKGIDVNVKSDCGDFALKYAAIVRKDQSGKWRSGLNMLEVLLSCPNIDVNQKDHWDRTALMWACINRSQEVVEKVLTIPGADINHHDLQGQTALLVSCKEGLKRVVRLLLEQPTINVNHRDHEGMTALMWACWLRRMDIVKMLLDIPDIDANCQDIQEGNTAMMHVVLHYCSTEYVKVFAEHDSMNWNVKNKRGQDVLTMALNKPIVNVDVIECLLNIPSLKPDVNLLRDMKLYKKAASLCRKIVSNKMRSSGICYSTESFNVANLYAFAFANGMKNIATIIIPDQDAAVESCRLHVAERMSNDETLHPQHNMTELLYALKKGMDNLALVLMASGVKVTDILLMCKIFNVEEEKLRLEAEAQEKIEDAIPPKRSKFE